MNNDDKKAFLTTLKAVHDFYRADLTGSIGALWWNIVQGYSLEQVNLAFSGHMADPKSGQYLPKPADLVRILQGTHEQRALLAWGKVLDAMQRVGSYTDVVFDDAAIHAAVEDLGGWVKVCRTDNKELSYVQHRFCESHRAYASRGDFEYPKRLTGARSPDDMFAMRGLPPPKPAVIGDQQQAMLVYEGGNAGGKTKVAFLSLNDLASKALRLGNPA